MQEQGQETGPKTDPLFPPQRTTQQNPSIGRIVHYQRHGSPDGTHKPEPSPAIITKVHANGTCSLTVFNPTGMYFNETPYSEEPAPGHWSWPPRV